MSRRPIENLVLALILAAGLACSRRAAVVDAGAPVRAAAVVALRDAGPDRAPDAAVDARPDGAAGAPARARRRAAAPRPEPAGGFRIEGAIGRAQAEAVLHGARGKVDACYDKARAQAPDLKGRVTFRLSVDGRGRVPLAEVVSSTLGGGDPELCMVEALRDLKFPASASGAASTLTFPMTFGR